MIKNIEELLEKLQEIGNQYQNKTYMKDINKLHQRQNKLVLEAINSILNDLYTTSEGIKKYKSEDSLLTVKQNVFITKLLKEKIPVSTKANITSSFEAIKNNSFNEHMYIGSQ